VNNALQISAEEITFRISKLNFSAALHKKDADIKKKMNANDFIIINLIFYDDEPEDPELKTYLIDLYLEDGVTIHSEQHPIRRLKSQTE
jgi:hypothetical protein